MVQIVGRVSLLNSLGCDLFKSRDLCGAYKCFLKCLHFITKTSFWLLRACLWFVAVNMAKKKEQCHLFLTSFIQWNPRDLFTRQHFSQGSNLLHFPDYAFISIWPCIQLLTFCWVFLLVLLKGFVLYRL